MGKQDFFKALQEARDKFLSLIKDPSKTWTFSESSSGARATFGLWQVEFYFCDEDGMGTKVTFNNTPVHSTLHSSDVFFSEKDLFNFYKWLKDKDFEKKALEIRSLLKQD